MNCEYCDQPCTHEMEHYKDVRDEHDVPIVECSGWTCKHMDWRKRALEAEAKVIQLEASVRNLWETSNA